MRVLLWLFAAPAVTLVVVWLTGPVGPLATLGAALGGQVAAYPLWHQLERRRTLEALRRFRHERRGVIVRGRLSRSDMAAQLALRALGALLIAAAFLLVVQ